MNINEFKKELSNLNISYTKEIIDKLETYYELLIESNKKFNLTAITEKKQVYLKHFYDSLCLAKTNLLKENINLCDIGTGAGFPGIVISIFFKKINITLVESNNKKCLFLKEVINKLDLKNINVINKRAEEYAKEFTEKYDIVTSRAVSKLRILSEYSTPLLKINGYFLPLKASIEDELNLSKNAFFKLDLKLINIINYKLPIEKSERNILILKKIKKTSSLYPREYKQIIKKPL